MLDIRYPAWHQLAKRKAATLRILVERVLEAWATKYVAAAGYTADLRRNAREELSADGADVHVLLADARC